MSTTGRGSCQLNMREGAGNRGVGRHRLGGRGGNGAATTFGLSGPPLCRRGTTGLLVTDRLCWSVSRCGGKGRRRSGT